MFKKSDLDKLAKIAEDLAKNASNAQKNEDRKVKSKCIPDHCYIKEIHEFEKKCRHARNNVNTTNLHYTDCVACHYRRMQRDNS